jgi:hypothetical protein
MTKSAIHFLSLVSLAALAACANNDRPTVAGSTPVPAVAQARGDVVASQLYALPATKVVGPRAAISRPAAGNDAVGAPSETVTHRFRQGIVHVAANSPLASVVVPVTQARGTKIAVAPGTMDRAENLAALNQVVLATPTGAPVPALMVKRDGPTAVEEGHSGVWNLDAAALPGNYALTLAPSLARSGADILVFEPESTIEMAVTAITPIVMAGTAGTIRVTLTDAGKPITGANCKAHLQTSTEQNGPSVTMKEIGNGVYEATVTEVLTEKSSSGVYSLKVQADGSSNGARFVRTGNGSFTFAVPTGRVTSTNAPRLVRNVDGAITAFEADVNVEASSADRFEITALLTVLGPDGFEHPVAEAQTAENLDVGTHTMTLSFDAGWAQLAKAEGVLHVRKLSLYSQGQQVLLHRADDGFSLAFESVAVADLKPLDTVPPGAKAMLNLGMLQRVPATKPAAPAPFAH